MTNVLYASMWYEQWGSTGQERQVPMSGLQRELSFLQWVSHDLSDTYDRLHFMYPYLECTLVVI
eukprot:CAMPEP_0198699738 /NCGR_PEP_ID=MMETSP1468-20131203/358646_1 /TAXON_ID=1461545 /ORGANISM="Mantoniella sp, Strain CCMP1436" /LENGTH=63 /DNA_ID=CAMNT_0044457357 /DNA_START=35 /DNA_END=226 /DNA_ORIENTATION=-